MAQLISFGNFEHEPDPKGMDEATLRAYLSSGNRVTAAANELYINHSTLNYRLKKLHSNFGIDVEDSRSMNALRFGLINFDKR